MGVSSTARDVQFHRPSMSRRQCRSISTAATVLLPSLSIPPSYYHEDCTKPATMAMTGHYRPLPINNFTPHPSPLGHPTGRCAVEASLLASGTCGRSNLNDDVPTALPIGAFSPFRYLATDSRDLHDLLLPSLSTPCLASHCQPFPPILHDSTLGLYMRCTQ